MRHILQPGTPVPHIIVVLNKVTAVSNVPNRLQILVFGVLRYNINIHYKCGNLVTAVSIKIL